MTEKQYYQKIDKLYNRGMILEAEHLLAQARSRFGKSKMHHFFMGLIALDKKKFDAALQEFTKAYQHDPKDVQVLYSLGVTATGLCLYADAMGWFKKVLSLKKDHIPSLLRVSSIFDLTGNPSAAEKTCRIILSVDSENAGAYNNLGNIYANTGKPNEAVDAYLKGLQLDPSLNKTRSNLLLALNYVATDGQELRRDHENIANVWDAPRFTHHLRPLNGRKLRVGLASPDFRRHSVAYFLVGLFEAINRDLFFLAAYANVDRFDDLTHWFEEKSDLWRNIRDLSSEETADRIHSDRIDILIDLAGHTRESNLEMFGFQPAPIQLSWLGYPASTGMKTIQYRLTDALADPVGAESHYTETLCYLPNFLNYSPGKDLPECDFSAMAGRDYPVFGSFNNIAKLGPMTIELWAAVLSAIPHARLLLKHKHFNDSRVQEDFVDRFKRSGIDEDRLIFQSFDFTVTEHLQRYNQIDIALDSYPYNGTTTTFEAMVMGVPTLTLTGELHAARVGTAIMKGVGLPGLVAGSLDQFVEKAVNLAEDRRSLLFLKEGLRNRFFNSPFADKYAFSRSFEKALIEIWENHQA